jgi:uncharacterized protein YbjT (DUF2867 family)
VKILVAGAHGFVGRALCPALVAAGHDVRAGGRRRAALPAGAGTPVRFDLDEPATLAPALVDVDAVIWLVHGLALRDFAAWEQEVAARFVDVARASGLRRLVYLGGVTPTTLTPSGREPVAPSPHLTARLRTGALLRQAAPHALELRAGVVIGAGGASFRLLRDIAARAPVLARLPWLSSEQQPVALADVVAALVAVVDRDVDGVLDVPGPTVITTEALLRQTAALLGRRVRFVDVAVPPAWVIEAATRLTRADAGVVRGILDGAGAVDYLAPDDGVYAAVAGLPRTPLRTALRQALIDEERAVAATPTLAAVEDALARLWR